MPTFFSDSTEMTVAFGEKLGKVLKADTVLALHGDLGAGKTTLMRGLLAGITGNRLEGVQSPTFVYLNSYSGKLPCHHFDLYRLSGEEAFMEMGFEEYFDGGGVCCIEWAERIESILPERVIHLHLHHEGEGQRRIQWSVDLPFLRL